MDQIHEIMKWSATAIDLAASLIMIWGFVTSVAGVIKSSFSAGNAHSRIRSIQVIRCGLGVKLVFALELMIISDLLHTVISRSVDDLLLVGGLVVIRAVVAYFLNKEIQEVGAELAQQDNNG
jgi:uncharacterized membrane protein